MTIALVGLGALGAAVVQAGTGLGFALVLAPVLFALLSPAGAMVTVTALGLELNLLVLLAERRRPSVSWPELAPILIGSLPGAVCGVLVLRSLSRPPLQIVVGTAVIIAALLRVRARRTDAGPGSVPGRLTLGALTGALTTSAGVSGPPLALWLSGRGLTPGEVRDALSALFLAIGLVAGFALLPVLGRAHLGAGLLVAGCACVIGGHALGSRLFARIGAPRFDPILHAVILATGAASVVAGTLAL